MDEDIMSDMEVQEAFYDTYEDDAVVCRAKRARARDRLRAEQDQQQAERDRRKAELDRQAALKKQRSLQRSMIQFIRHTSASDFVLEESATLRLVKALHEQELEDVILSFHQGAKINFQVRFLRKLSFCSLFLWNESYS